MVGNRKETKLKQTKYKHNKIVWQEDRNVEILQTSRKIQRLGPANEAKRVYLLDSHIFKQMHYTCVISLTFFFFFPQQGINCEKTTLMQP